MSKRICGLLCKVGAAIITGALTVALPCAAQQLTNDKLSLTVDGQAGSYQLRVSIPTKAFGCSVARSASVLPDAWSCRSALGT